VPVPDRVIQKADPEANPRVPSIKIQDGRLYVGEIHVFKEHLNEKELQEYFPEDYFQKYRAGEILCPVPHCPEGIRRDDKRSLVMHARQKHPDWYEENRKLISEARSVEELTAKLKSASATV